MAYRIAFGNVPSHLRKAVVIPIFKTGDHEDPGN